MNIACPYGQAYNRGLERLSELVKTGPELRLLYLLTLLNSDQEKTAIDKMQEFPSYKWMLFWKETTDLFQVCHNYSPGDSKIPIVEIYPGDFLRHEIGEWKLSEHLTELCLLKISDLRHLHNHILHNNARCKN